MIKSNFYFFIIICISFWWKPTTSSKNEIDSRSPAKESGFIANLKKDMESFASENSAYQSKPGQYSPLQTRLETEDLTIPSSTMSLVTHVSKDDIAQIVAKYSSQTRNQRNCLTIRKFLEVLPSTTSYYTSFWSWTWSWLTSADPHQEMKSYRTMAYNILRDAAFKSPALREEVRTKISELQAMKVMYFHKYYKVNRDEVERKKRDKVSTQKELANLHIKMTALRTKMRATEEAIDRKNVFFQNYVRLDSGKRNSLKVIFEEIDRLTNLKSRVEIVSSAEEVADMLEPLGFSAAAVELREKLLISGDFAEVTASVEYLVEEGGLDTKKLETATALLGDMQTKQKRLESEIEELKKRILTDLSTRLGELEKKVKADASFALYTRSVKEIIREKKEYNAQKREMSELKVEAERKYLDLDTFNVQEYSDFVLPATVLFNLKAKFEQMRKIHTFDGQPNPRETGSSLRAQFARSPDPVKYNDYLDSLENTQFVLQRGLDDNIESCLRNLVHQMYVVGEIEERERRLDELLGRVFAEVFEMERGSRCFTLPQLSFFLFNMFKTNVVANQHRFLAVFLGHLRPEQRREFVVYNYSLFATKEFISNFEERFDVSATRPREVFDVENEYISQFTVNFLSVVDMYKDLTEFRNTENSLDRGGMFVTVWRAIGADLGRLLLEDVSEYVIEQFVKLLVKKLIGLIPFVSAVPFLDEVAGYVAWKVTKFISKRIIKLFGKFADTINRATLKCLRELRSRKFSLDFEREIADAFNPEPPSTRLDVSFQNLDRIYSQAYESESESKSDLFLFALEESFFFRLGDSSLNFYKFQTNLDFFNKYVVGELLMKRLFQSGAEVSVIREGVPLNLSVRRDYSERTELFDSIFRTLTSHVDWRSFFFRIYKSPAVDESPELVEESSNLSEGQISLDMDDDFNKRKKELEDLKDTSSNLSEGSFKMI